MLTLWRFVSLPDLSRHQLRALFPLVGIALGVAVFIAVRVTNISTLGAFARTVDAIAGRAGLEITGRGALKVLVAGSSPSFGYTVTSEV